MYTNGCGGLGELLDTAHQSSSTNTQYVLAHWDEFQAGAIIGSNWSAFKEAVTLGWVPDTRHSDIIAKLASAY